MKISKKEQLRKIKHTVIELTESLEDLTIEIDIIDHSIAVESRTIGESLLDCNFVKGDTLQITNNYKGIKRTFGKVKHTTQKQCTIVDFHGTLLLVQKQIAANIQYTSKEKTVSRHILSTIFSRFCRSS